MTLATLLTLVVIRVLATARAVMAARSDRNDDAAWIELKVQVGRSTAAFVTVFTFVFAVLGLRGLQGVYCTNVDGVYRLVADLSVVRDTVELAFLLWLLVKLTAMCTRVRSVSRELTSASWLYLLLFCWLVFYL